MSPDERQAAIWDSQRKSTVPSAALCLPKPAEQTVWWLGGAENI